MLPGFPLSQEWANDTPRVYHTRAKTHRAEEDDSQDRQNQTTRGDWVSSFPAGRPRRSPVRQAASPGTEELPAGLEVEGASPRPSLEARGLCCAPASFLLTQRVTWSQSPSHSLTAGPAVPQPSHSQPSSTWEALTLLFLGSSLPTANIPKLGQGFGFSSFKDAGHSTSPFVSPPLSIF